MDEKRFTNIAIGVIISLLVLIAVLSIIGMNIPPQMREVRVNGGQEYAEIANQSVQILFSQPMKQSPINVTVIPEIEHTVLWQNNTLFIYFPQLLQNNTEYTLTIESEIVNIYGKSLEGNKTFTFKTKEARVTFWQYPNKIVSSDIEGKDVKILYEGSGIVNYIRYDSTLAVLRTPKDGRTDIVFVDAKTGKSTIKTVNFAVYSLYYSKAVRKLLLLAQDVGLNGTIPQFPQNIRRMYFFDLDSSALEPIIQSGVEQEIESFTVSDDGRMILFRDIVDGLYYLVDVRNPNAPPILIGNYIVANTFDNNGKNILLTKEDDQSVQGYLFAEQYSVTGQKKRVSPQQKHAIEGTFIHQTPYLAYSEKSNAASSVLDLFRIVIIDSNSGKELFVLTENGASYETPKSSRNGQYLIVEKFTENVLETSQSERIIGFRQKATSAELYLVQINTLEAKKLPIIGINVIWEE